MGRWRGFGWDCVIQCGLGFRESCGIGRDSGIRYLIETDASYLGGGSEDRIYSSFFWE